MQKLHGCMICLFLIACRQEKSTSLSVDAKPVSKNHPISAAAIELTKGPYVMYDPSYKSIPYPNGDVAPDHGVCADVVVRTFRAVGHDLQQLTHEDMKSHFHLYPNKWGLRGPDPNIDHRRVPNLMTFFERHGENLTTDETMEDYLPGDVVAWQLSDGRTHIGIVIDDFGDNGWPLVVHNIGNGQEKANVLFSWKVIGHYRYTGKP
jgi:uncharacterized protein YijF (DUF1287 family)